MTTQWMAAVGAVALVAPWVAVVVTSSGDVSPNLVAIPANGDNINAAVSPSFATAPYFLVVNVDTTAVTVIENPYASDPQPLGLKASFVLLGERVGVVLTPDMGPAARNLLDSRGVRLFQIRSLVARDALQEFRSGLAKKLPPPSPPPEPGGGGSSGTAPEGGAPCIPQAEALPGRISGVTARSSGAFIGAGLSANNPPVSLNSSIAAPTPIVRSVAPQTAAVAPAPSMGWAPPAWAGSTVAGQPSPDLVLQFGLQVTSIVGVGVQVIAIVPGSRAQWAGFRPGDIIVRLGQTIIRNADQLRQILSQTPADRDQMIRVLRNDGAVERLLIWGGDRDRMRNNRLTR